MNNYGNGAGYFLYVSEIGEVYNYMVPQGQTMFFMNKDQPILYIKSVNMFNQQTVSVYDLVERKQEVPQMQTPAPSIYQGQAQPQPQPQYVTREELTSVIAETIRSELKQNKKPYYTKKEEN